MKRLELTVHGLRSASNSVPMRGHAAYVGIAGCTIVLALAACGDNPVAPDAGGDTDGNGPSTGLSVRTVGTLDPTNIRGVALAALDEHHVAIVRSTGAGEAFCPDCVDLDPSQCPALCKRTEIQVLSDGIQTGTMGPALPVVTVFPASYDHDVNLVDIVGLGSNRVGVAWLDCDNSKCTGLFAKQSCTARYRTVDLTSGALGDVQTLYTHWFGDLQLAFEPTSRHVLALVGKHEAFGVGLRRAIFDETGAVTFSPWASLGSSSARAATVLASEGNFLVVADDASPTSAGPAVPCAASCDCLAPTSPIDAATGGLHAFHIGDGPDRRELVALGVGTDGFYGC